MANTDDIYRFIGEKIRELRNAYCGHGISQEALAGQVGTTTNTISRWETATYKPSVLDLEKLARFFGVPISVFLPELAPNTRVQALLSATGDLDEEDLEEVTRYAQFRRARKALRDAKSKPKKRQST
jgi:transcriptional regulator with XRE-family HTH domain